jgi:hypothetical protein
MPDGLAAMSRVDEAAGGLLVFVGAGVLGVVAGALAAVEVEFLCLSEPPHAATAIATIGRTRSVVSPFTGASS